MYLVRVILFAVIAGIAAALISSFLNGGELSRGIPTGVGAAIGTGIAFAWMFARITAEVPGLTLAEAEAQIAGKNLLKGFRRSDAGGNVVYTAGRGLMANEVSLQPSASGVRLDGMRSVVNQVRKRLTK